MATDRKNLVWSLIRVGVVAGGALTVGFVGLLWYLLRHPPAPGEVSGLLVLLALLVLGATALVAAGVIWWLDRQFIAPLATAETVATQVSGGDLTVPAVDPALVRTQGGQIIVSIVEMVEALRRLTTAIQSAAADAAAMAEEIAASTQEMTASTQEVASTTGDLTERATQQALVVRMVAEDAGRIQAIAQELAAGAIEAAERNSALAQAARAHRERLDASTAELSRFNEEVEAGAEEAEALVASSGEIEKFVAQTKAIAKRTHMLALNASIEAARAGEEGRGFSVVAEEVRKLASQAAQAATTTSDTVQEVLNRVQSARQRLLRLGQGGMVARDAAHAAAAGLENVAGEADANDAWTRRISASANEVRELIEGIAGRMKEVSASTEDYAAAAEEIAAAAEQLNASTEEISSSAGHLAEAADRLTSAAGGFRLH